MRDPVPADQLDAQTRHLADQIKAKSGNANAKNQRKLIFDKVEQVVLCRADEQETAATIRTLRRETGYVADPHTAVAVAVTGVAYDYARAVLASTSLALGNVRPGAADTLSVANEVITSSTYQDGLLVAATSGNGNLALTNPAKIAAGLTGNVGVKANLAGSLDATAADLDWR